MGADRRDATSPQVIHTPEAMPDVYGKVGIAGTGTIACGLAAVASTGGEEVVVLARSDESADRARASIDKFAGKLDGADAAKVTVTTDRSDLDGCELVVEAIVEEVAAKGELLNGLGELLPEADLATTTSSLGVAAIGDASGHPERVFGLHPFNPVPRMDLVELCVLDRSRDGTADRATAWCESLGKTVVPVPDTAGFVVNRLLFPYLFDAVRFQVASGVPPEDVDRCMNLGAAHPLGPLALLDLVGLDVSQAIGEALFAESGDEAHKPPERLAELIGEGKLGRKSGAGFFDYSA